MCWHRNYYHGHGQQTSNSQKLISIQPFQLIYHLDHFSTCFEGVCMHCHTKINASTNEV